MNDTHQENEVPAGPLLLAIPAYGFAMALYLDWLGRSPTRQTFPPTLRETHISISSGLKDLPRVRKLKTSRRQLFQYLAHHARDPVAAWWAPH